VNTKIRISATIASAARRRVAVGVGPAILILCCQASLSAQTPSRVDRLNQAFLRHIHELDDRNAIAVSTILQGWADVYRDEIPESFVPDALAVLHPAYRDALRAFDDERPREVVRLLAPLLKHADPYLAANAEYFHVRALAGMGRYERIEEILTTLEERKEHFSRHTPYAPHLWFIKSFCEARDLRYERARRSLDALEALFPDMPEAVSVGGRQLRLEIERREQGTLGEVADVMDYVADRLNAADRSERVHDHQRKIVALLDRLIDRMEQQEQQQSGRGGAAGENQKPPRQPVQNAKRESDAPKGAGRTGDLHDAPNVKPGESWGKLPPSERERILQSIRERFPSRYRQLVEQYYRSLAEEK